ncbi:calcium-binding protein [Grimontia sp. S25]|uniref:Calcium-binding protein n=1 Tax=Grimontia sedimenti TaxID=2711294 RepID=A0A6M1RM78_9GAMM|nr:calcium-binding protein [Grimontia sedimenti]NGN97177.1 calcium-binding protein [Grimontia sedimenti]
MPSTMLDSTDNSSKTSDETSAQTQFLYSADTILSQSGTEGADAIEGTDGNDFLYGLGGSDLLSGNAGDDFIDGGAGHDSIRGGSGNDQAYGGEGNDQITNSEKAVGGAGNDMLIGNVDASYTLIGGAGRDWIEGYGNDTLRGGSDNDVLISLGNQDKALGGTGDDALLVVGSLGQGTHLWGGDGNDLLAGNHNDQLLFGGSGSDTFFFGANVLNRDLYFTLEKGTDISISSGHDRIVDFELDKDVISIDNQIASDFSELTIDQVGMTTVITLSEDSTITLNSTDATSLTSAHFSFNDAIVHSGMVSYSQNAIDRFLAFRSTDNQFVETQSGISGPREFRYTDAGDGNDARFASDVSTGGLGEDTFVFNVEGGDNSPQYITDFQPGIDHLRFNADPDLEGLNVDASSYAIDVTQDGDNTIVSLNGKETVLMGVDASDFSIERDISFNISAPQYSGLPQQNNVFVGGSGDDALNGYDGNDRLSGGRGDDILIGGEHGDVLKGEDGNDILVAGPDNSSGYNNDILNGGNGDDQLYAGLGSDTLTGGQGADTFYIGDWNASTTGVGNTEFIVTTWRSGDYDHTIRDFNATEDALVISHRVFGTQDIDLSSLQFAQSGSDTVIDIAEGHSVTLLNTDISELTSANTEFFLNGNNVVGTDFNDHIEGSGVLDGGKGNDTLQGIWSNDLLTGGEGSDIFMFHHTTQFENDIGHDTITDFDVNEDFIAFKLHEATLDYSQLQISQQGTDTVIEATVDNASNEEPFTITLSNTDAAYLTEDHFIFG